MRRPATNIGKVLPAIYNTNTKLFTDNIDKTYQSNEAITEWLRTV